MGTGHRLAHTPLISQTDYPAAQAIRTNPDTRRRPRPYVPAGRTAALSTVWAADESHWMHGRPGYRCRHGHTSAKPAAATRPTVYLREDDLLTSLRTHLNQTNGDQPTIGHESRDLTAFLHANQTTITCGASAWDLSITTGLR